MKHRLSPGFTLVELLVVIAIIGLLATFAVTQLSGARDKARIAKGQAQSGQILRSTGDDLVARWDFDECTGATANDLSGYGNTATLVGPPAWSSSVTPSGQGCSLSFDGSDRVNFTMPSSLGGIQTRTMWVYIIGPVSGNQYLIDEGGNVNTLSVYNNRFYAMTSASYILASNTIPVTGKWYFLVATSDGSTLKLYVDGSLDKSIAALPQTPGSSGSIGEYTPGGSFFLTGYMDDVRLYARSLTGKEIHRMYAEGLPRHLAASQK